MYLQFSEKLLAYFVNLYHLLRHAFATLSFIAETFLFLYVGMDALDIEKWKFASDRSETCTYHLYTALPNFYVWASLFEESTLPFLVAALVNPLG